MNGVSMWSKRAACVAVAGLAFVVLFAQMTMVRGAPIRPMLPSASSQTLYSFETGLEGWSGSIVGSDVGGTVAITTTHTTAGAQALQLNTEAGGGFFGVQPSSPKSVVAWQYLKFDIYSAVPHSLKFIAQSGGAWTWKESTTFSLDAGVQTVTVDLLTGFDGGPLPDPSSVRTFIIYTPAQGTYVVDNMRLEGPLPTATPTSTPTPILQTPTPPAVMPGFRVAGRFLYDRCGEKVVPRGVNKKNIWEDKDGTKSFPEIAKTGANIVRIVWLTTGTAAELETVISNAVANKLIPMVELHDATGDWSKLPSVVDYWTRADIVAVLENHEQHLLINIGNEIGNGSVTEQQFKEGYRLAILRMRLAGIHVPLVIDSSNWGQDIDRLQSAGPYLLSIDPDHNLMFDVHMWWPLMWGYNAQRVIDEIDESVRMGLPLIVAEFGNKWEDNAGGQIPYLTILEHTYAREVGMLPWEWGPNNQPQTWLDMTKDSTYDTLFDWGLEVAVTHPYSILNTATRPYSILNGTCPAGPTPTAQPAPTTYAIPPVVSLSAPASDTLFAAGASIPITATVSAEGAPVRAVEFFVNGVKVGEATSAPYSFVWSNVATGSYAISARAVDTLGASATSQTIYVAAGFPGQLSVNDATTGGGLHQFEYSEGWNVGAGAQKYRGDDHYASGADAYALVRFKGTQIDLFGTTAAHHGIAAVSIDDGEEELVDLYSTSTADQALLWSSPALALGEHTLKVRVTGTKNISSTDKVISVDRVLLDTGYTAINLPIIAFKGDSSIVPTPTTTPTTTPTASPTSTLPPTLTLPVPSRTPWPTSTPTATGGPAVPTITLYDEAISADWSSWSWDTTFDASATGTVYAGTNALSLAYTAGWGSFRINYNPTSALSTTGYSKITFWAHPGSGGARSLLVYTQPADGQFSTEVSVTVPDGGWTKIEVPLSSLGNPAVIRLFGIKNGTGTAQPVFYIDNLQIVP